MLKPVAKLSIFVIAALNSFLTQPAHAETLSFTVVERATTDAVVDVGATGDSPGDMLTFANELFDKDNVTRIGTDSGYCIRTSVGVAWQCAWTNALSGGQISVQGIFLDAGDSVITITGGTGDYKGAKGEMLLHARDAKGSAFDFSFSIDR